MGLGVFFPFFLINVDNEVPHAVSVSEICLLEDPLDDSQDFPVPLLDQFFKLLNIILIFGGDTAINLYF